MIIGKGAFIFGFTAILAAIAAPPKLRASTKKIAATLRSGTKIAALVAQHGHPYHLYHALYRIPTLSNVILETCDGNPTPPTGRNACYLVNSTQETANLGVFGDLAEWLQDHVQEWFLLFKNNEGTFDLQSNLEYLTGQSVTGLSNLTLVEFKAVIGAAERSLRDEPIDNTDLWPIFDNLDKNKDGLYSMQEKMEVSLRECDNYAGELVSCDFYMQLLELYTTNSTMSFEEWGEEIVSEGASVREEVSGKFHFFSSS